MNRLVLGKGRMAGIDPQIAWTRIATAILGIFALFSVHAGAQSACLAGYECVPLYYYPWCHSIGGQTCHGVPSTVCEEVGPTYTGVRTWDDELAWAIDSYTCFGYVSGTAEYVGSITERDNYEALQPIGKNRWASLHMVASNGAVANPISQNLPATKKYVCPVGFTIRPHTDLCDRPITSILFPKERGDCDGVCGGPSAGNPINAGIGNKFQTEIDYIGTGAFPLKFSRTYNSIAAPTLTSIGGYWQSSFDRAIRPWGSTGKFVAYRADGKSYIFTMSGNQGMPDVDVRERLAKTVDGSGNFTGWTLTTIDDEVEVYDTSGMLQSVTNRDGFAQVMTYSDASTPISVAPYPNLLIRVADPQGRALTFTYDSQSRITTMSDPSGGLFQYAYTSMSINAELVSRTDPSSGVRTYIYNESAYTSGTGKPHALTGIQDENLHRFATYSYASNGKALTSEHAGGSDKVTITYTSATQSKVLDVLGTERTYTLATLNGVVKPTAAKRPCASCSGGFATETRTYDANGYPDLSTDFNGTVTDTDYDSRGLQTKRVEASNDASPPATSSKRTIDTAWNAGFRVPDQRSIKNANGAVETLTEWMYNFRGQATARCQVDPAVSGASMYTCGSSTNAPAGVRQSATAYCESSDVTAGTCPLVGLVTSINGARLTTDAGMGGLDDTTTYTYYLTDDASCSTGGACPHRKGDLWKITNALGQVTEYLSYDKSGRVARTKDANGTYTDFVYHPRGWLTDRIMYANASGTIGVGDAALHVDYDAVGNVTKVTQPDGAFLSYIYDDAHRLLKISDNLGNAIDYCAGGVGAADCLDAAGNRKVEQVKDPSNAVKRQLHRVYNQLGQLTKVLNAVNSTVETSLGITATGIADGYDGNGNRTLKDDGLGFRTKQDYDPLNRLKDTIQNYAGIDTATQNTTTQYTYDARDNLRQVTDPDGLNTVYTYDGLNNLNNLSSPDTGGTSYQYDAAGNRISQTDNRGITSTYTYDTLNRLTGIAYPTTSLNVSYAYDQADITTGCSGSFPIGRLTTMTDASGSTTYCYDRHGNVTKKSQVTSGTGLITQYSYTVADRLATLTYPSGAIVTYTRDVLGRVQAIDWQASSGGSTIPLIGSATYYPFGPLNVLTYGNGRTLTKDYDQDYAINAISGTPAGALTLDFGVDVMGDITSASGSITPPTADRIYQYDPLYRLTTAQTGTPSPLESYTYNKTGDRQSASLNGGAAQTYLYTAGTHRLASVAGTARTYDGNGNTQTGTAASLTLGYDDRNRLTTATQGTMSASYKISGRGERVGKTVTISGTPTTTLYSYDQGGRITGEYGSTGTMQAEYIYLDGTPVGVAKGSTLYYIEADHLGTPRQVIDRARNVAVWKWDSLGNTFGTAAPNQDPDVDSTPFIFNLRFPGQIADTDTGLNYNYFRDYEPAAGRYVESDPIGLTGGMITYGYARSSPVQISDPKGLIVGLGWGDQTWDIHKNANHACFIVALSAWWQAREQSIEAQLPGPWNGPADAFRHCVWSCVMTRLHSADCAKIVGDAHEAAGDARGQKPNEHDMDDYNNREGRDAGCMLGKSCHERCKDKLQNCELRGLDGRPLCYPPR